MGQVTGIEWCHHTFNPWRGCTKVSPGCAHCYAETQSKRNPKVLGTWGPDGVRSMASESYWRLPVKWDAEAKAEGVRKRVFCASLADVFEDRPELEAPRQRLFDLILATPNLDWLLLTKRPNVMHDWLTGAGVFGDRNAHQWGDGWPNVWLGTSIEDQIRADDRVPQLLAIPAVVRFLSIEPLLGPIDLREWGYVYHGRNPVRKWEGGKLNWIIVGGESGPGARPMHPDWARSIRDQCQAAQVPFFYKQWGEYAPDSVLPPMQQGESRKFVIVRPDGGDRIHQSDGKFSGDSPQQCDEWMYHVGKKAAGRLLDGKLWSEFPAVSHS